MAKRQRGQSTPLGINLICGLTALVDIGTLLFLVLPLFGMGGPAAAIATVLLALLAVDMAAVYGLWTLREWGWVLSVVLCSVFLFGSLAQGELLGFLVGLLILDYIVSKRDLYVS